MKLSSHHKPHKIKPFEMVLILLIFSLFIFQAQSIKFFTKQAQEKPNSLPDTITPPKVQDQSHKQITSSKHTEQPKNEDSKPYQVKQKTLEAKPQQSTPSPSPKLEQKQQPKSSTDKSLEHLFQQSTNTKSVQSSSLSAPTVTLKAEERRTNVNSVPLSSSKTVVTSPDAEPKAQESKSMIGGLFANEKDTKPKDEKPKVESPQKKQQNSQQEQKSTDVKPQLNNSGKKHSKKEKSTDPGKTEDQETKSDTDVKIKDTDKTSQKVSQQDKESDIKKQQEQSSGDVYYPSKKEPQKKKGKPQTQVKQQTEKDQTQSQAEQEQSVEQKDDKSTSQSKQQDSESEQSQVIRPKKQPKKQGSNSPSNQQNEQQSKQKYSLTLFMTFCLYSLIIVLVVITIKCTSSSSKIVRSVERIAGGLWNMFLIKKGYRKMPVEEHDEQVTQKEEQITVGYHVEDNNKQIFWEKNSVQGI